MSVPAESHSIQRRVLQGSIMALLLGLLISSVLSYWSTRHEVGELFDANLIENSRVIKGLINKKMSPLDWQVLQQSLDETLLEHVERSDALYDGHAYEKKLAVQVWSDHAQLVVRSPSAPHHALAPLRAGIATFETDQYDWMVYTVLLEQNQHWLVVAERSDIRTELTTNIEASLVFGAFCGFCFAIWWLRRELIQAFEPMRQLSNQIAARQMDDLQPIKLISIPHELFPIVSEINALFSRIETTLERERHFLANSAHELRTPLTVMKLQVEQALQQPEQQTEMLKRLAKSVERHQQLIEQMLLLARLESQQAPLALEQMMMDSLVREAVAQLYPLAMLRNIDFFVDCQPLDILGDRRLLMSLLTNLIDNAIKHSPDHTTIDLTLHRHKHTNQLSIRDHGRGIPPEALSRVLDRYYQAVDMGGSGVGLALVKQIAAIHHIHIHMHNHPQGGLLIELSWESSTLSSCRIGAHTT